MNHAEPRGLNWRRVQQLLAICVGIKPAGARLERISREFLGRPYTINALTGSAHTPEVFRISLDRFDCVTYIETVMALSQAATPDEFVERMRQIRYEGGQIQWDRRNHYMTSWIRNNARAGALRKVSLGPRISKFRVLDAVPELPPVRARFECVPKAYLPGLSNRLNTGDLIFFASTRPHLDIFHCGILVNDGRRLRLRHASRSRNGVVEQDLSEFLKKNRMAGVIAVRPAAFVGKSKQ
jgi:cell wall-associated NlpC family hydrolase